MNIKLQNPCITMLVSASQNSDAPYWADTAGPNSHSPVPMLVPASTTPGPISAAHKAQPLRGGSGRLLVVHGASDPAATVVSVVMKLALRRKTTASKRLPIIRVRDRSS